MFILLPSKGYLGDTDVSAVVYFMTGTVLVKTFTNILKYKILNGVI